MPTTRPKALELIDPAVRRPYRAAFFDFDGTLSLLREGWHEIMADLFDESYRPFAADQGDGPRKATLEEGIMRLNGRPPVIQMGWYCDHLREAGGPPLDPVVLLDEFRRRMNAQTDPAKARLAEDASARIDWLVPGAREMLAALKRRGVFLVLASGTDLKDLRHECDLLGLTEYFGDEIYGPTGTGAGFAKREVVEVLVRRLGGDGTAIVGVGDGMIELGEVKKVGGGTVAVAHDPRRPGEVCAWKRPRLVEAGADVLVSDYGDGERLAAWVTGGD